MPAGKVDWETFTFTIGGIMAFASTVIGVMWKRINYSRELLKEVKEELVAHKLDVAENYPKTTEVKELLHPIDSKVSDIKADVRMLVEHQIKTNTDKK